MFFPPPKSHLCGREPHSKLDDFSEKSSFFPKVLIKVLITDIIYSRFESYITNMFHVMISCQDTSNAYIGLAFINTLKLIYNTKLSRDYILT